MQPAATSVHSAGPFQPGTGSQVPLALKCQPTAPRRATGEHWLAGNSQSPRHTQLPPQPSRGALLASSPQTSLSVLPGQRSQLSLGAQAILGSSLSLGHCPSLPDTCLPVTCTSPALRCSVKPALAPCGCPASPLTPRTPQVPEAGLHDA